MDKTKDKQLKERQIKIHKLVNWTLVDDKHRTWTSIRDTSKILLTLNNNVLLHPDDDSKKQIRITTNAYLKHIASTPGAEELLIHVGWRNRVINHERYMVFELAPEDSSLLEDTVDQLQRMLQLAESKIQSSKTHDKKLDDKKRLESVRAALEEDKEDRHTKFAASQQAEEEEGGGEGKDKDKDSNGDGVPSQ